ncbi:hypothetical protein [Cryobacterium sp. PH29-G1]|uniref:hypothetical protein n=1 Tax=Cryobacterium sp. PH29-G1 TaxID=3046211 RepID=UPI0024B8D980|nr:hypothetical protein [Cryobacterium sp. PH29-G1]MDJ0349417.1 hypothetical protein [Cryobacterium sp. PH29-G1]
MTFVDESVALAAQATFGRDGAMFESLLGFVAQLSLVLWSLVIVTAVFRFVGMRIYRKGANQAATVETAVSPATVPALVVTVPLTSSAVPSAPVPSAVVPSTVVASTVVPSTVVPISVATSVVVVPRTPRNPRSPRAQPRSSAQVPAHAANSMEL